MKKKILLTLLALACASTCAVGLAACGGGDDGGNGGGIYLVGSDGNVLDYGCSLGEFTYKSNDYTNIMQFKVCTKNADGKLVDLKENDFTIKYIDIIHDEQEISATGFSDFAAGSYRLEVSYKDNKVAAYFTVNKSDNAHYTTFVSKTDWKYGEDGATLSVYDNGSTLLTEGNDYDAKYITEADYNAIKDAADIKDQLSSKQQSYNENSLRSMTPGVYYIFAECYWTDNYNAAYSDFKKVTVTKGDLTIKSANSISTTPYSYAHSDKVGNIKLSDITVNNNEAYAENAFGKQVSGEFVWRNPDTDINSTNSGSKYWVSFVPAEEYRDYYNYENVNVLNAGQAEITVYKGYVNKPRYTNEDCGSDKFQGFGYERPYDGEAKNVYVDSAYYYDKYVDVTRGGQKMNNVTADNYGSTIDSVTNAGTYVYTLSLKDPVNYYWKAYGINIDEADQTDVADITFTFILNPMWSNVTTYGRPRLVPDKDGVIKLPITPYATPYEAGTLSVAKNNKPSDHSLDNVSLSIATENGVDYLVVSNFLPQDGTSFISELPVTFTATGKDNYADIDCNVKYTIDYAVDTNIASTDNINVYKGTKASVLYKNHPELKTTAGDYKLYILVGDEYYLVGDDATLEEVGEHKFKLEFDSSNIDENVVTVQKASVEFKMTCVQFDCPITAGAEIQATAGTNVNDILENYELQNEYGQWYFERQNEDGDWVTDIDGLEIPEGETKCRLYFQSNGTLAGKPEPVEFTIVGN